MRRSDGYNEKSCAAERQSEAEALLTSRWRVRVDIMNQCLLGGPSILGPLCRFPKAWFRCGSPSTSQSRFMASRLVREWSEITCSTARNANAKSVSLLRSNDDRKACERTSSRNRITVAASVRLCARGRFWLRRFCATLMASTIMRSELMGRKLTGHSSGSNRSSLVFKAVGFNI